MGLSFLVLGVGCMIDILYMVALDMADDRKLKQRLKVMLKVTNKAIIRLSGLTGRHEVQSPRKAPVARYAITCATRESQSEH